VWSFLFERIERGREGDQPTVDHDRKHVVASEHRTEIVGSSGFSMELPE
jgi:hypothetical protein